MSVNQSKENIRGGKSAGYYGRQSGGFMSRHSGEMTCDEAFTLARLQAFSPGEYESYCARGEEFRHRISGAVLNALKLSGAWRTDCESRGEWGGVFPVHLRLMHRKCRHVTIDILSPGGESPFWHGLMWLNPDHTGLYFWNSEQLPARLFCLYGEELRETSLKPEQENQHVTAEHQHPGFRI